MVRGSVCGKMRRGFAGRGTPPGQPLCCPMNRSYLNQNLLMFNSQASKPSKFGSPKLKLSMLVRTMPFSAAKAKYVQRNQRAGVVALCLWAAFLLLPSFVAAQDFTLQAAAFSPVAVAPGGTSSSNITVGSVSGFTGNVTLSCLVTSTTQSTIDPPVCSVSPATVTAPGDASATITTQSDTSTVGYTITISGTASTGTQTAPPLALTVLAVTPQFTVTVERTVAPTTVPAGSGGEGTVTINPINGYVSPGTGVTLSCASITPLVTIPPVCSFTPAVVSVSGTPITSTITISTFGPVTTGAMAHPHSIIFYGLWMPVPMLALLGLGAAAGGPRSRRVYGMLALFVICGALLLTPACGNSTASTSTPNGVTPNGTYSFTLMGVDSDGVISSNTTATTAAPTVSLTVNTPK